MARRLAPALSVLLLGVALCLAGATFDSPSLYVPGVALASLAAVALAWVRLAARGARVDRLRIPPSVVEEEPCPLRLEVRTGLLPPPGGELLEPLLGWPVPIAGRWSRRVRINVRFSRRGRRRLEPPRLVVRDPLRLHSVEVQGTDQHEVLVLPRVEPVRAAGASGGPGGAAGAGGTDEGAVRLGLDASTAELDIDGLRPHREGAPASRIHWPSVARRGEMLERRLVSDLDSAPLVVLDASRPAGEEALDAAVRAAASLCLHLARAGGCAVLLPGERRPTAIGPDLGAWPSVHARLALVQVGAPAPAVARASRGGAVLWVTAAGLHRAPTELGRLQAATRYLVMPSPLPGLRAAFAVAGCTGYVVGRARRPSRRAA